MSVRNQRWTGMDPTLGVFLMCLLAASANSIPTVEETTSNNTIIGDSEVTPNVSNYTIQLSSSASKSLENKLYNLIVSRKQNEAVTESLSLYGRGYAHLITNVVDRLITDGHPQVFDFAFKLVEARATYISRACFPTIIRMHEYLIFVKIIHYKYRFALKYGGGQDSDGDKRAYGDPNLSDRFEITWKFTPQWQGDRVYFIVRPIDYAIFLKMGYSKDKDGDHSIYGSNSYGSDRHLWYVKPVRYEGKILFYIINKEYDSILKLGYAIDSDGDRYAYGHSTREFNPERFAWELEIA